METTANKNSVKSERLMSLDVLRGFDMFWIIGGGALVVSLSKLNALSFLEPVAIQMRHVDFEGFRFWDLIFPLFMFISGVTIPFAILSKVEKGISKKSLQFRIVKRALILVILGLLYNGTLQKGFADMRFASVLGQIGLAYFIGATIVLQAKSVKVHALWLLVILAFISVLQLFVPVPGYGAGWFDPVKGMNAYVDQMLLPGRLSVGTYDRLGVLCIISASVLVLMGYFAGRLLRQPNITPNRKALYLLGTGVLFILFALVLAPVYPVVKSFWTTTFNFLTAGISLVLLAVFYYVIDVRKLRGRVFSHVLFFFKVIGLNSITIYMAARILPFREISGFFTGWLVEPAGTWIMIAGAITLEWLLLYYLYQQKIFLKV
ncbi:acyltransferase family protein [Mariniphaga sediminis]|uniref:acyltransferase family protein n=1 Tax=Mariniphaga sediminis TaxID=1628158 RepID=UPI00356A0D34